MNRSPISKPYHHEKKDGIESLCYISDYEHIVGNDLTIASPILSKRFLSIRELFALFSMSFSYALCFNTMNNLLIPRAIVRLTDNQQSLWVGALMTLGAFCQMLAPFIGAYSDRAGSRSMFLVYGSVLTSVGLLIFVLVEITDMLTVLFAAHATFMMGLSIVYSMTTALLNDHVLEEQTGKGSGVMAVLALFGSCTGYTMFALDVPIIYCLGFYVVATLFCLMVTMSVLPTAEHFRQLPYSVRLCDTIGAAFTIPSFRVFPDFIFSCIARALFSFGLAVQVYFVFFVRDILEHSRPVHTTSVLSLSVLVGGLLFAIPSGAFSDHIGRKYLIYASVCVCTASLMLLLVVRDTILLYMVGFIYGVGTASYLSVDYALGISTLPRKHGVPIDAAKDLGLFATSATVGTVVGQVIYGAVLHSFVGKTASGELRYNFLGFFMVYMISCLAFVLSGAVVAFIRVK